MPTLLSDEMVARNTMAEAEQRSTGAGGHSPGPIQRQQWPERRNRRHRWLGLLSFLAICLSARAQSSQFLPEVDTYLTVNPLTRLSFQAKQTREGGDPTQVEIGPSADFYLKPWVKLQNATVFDLDGAKKRALVVSAGYRYLPSPDAPTTNRLELVATVNFPIRGGFLVSDRNRADLDWQGGKFDWRYRNRLSLEKSLSVEGYHPRAYLRSEEFYESNYQKWSTTALYAGGIFPIGRRLALSPYYCHQNNTGKKPNQQLNQIGLVTNFYFSVEKNSSRRARRPVSLCPATECFRR
jgi:hypothetical protein